MAQPHASTSCSTSIEQIADVDVAALLNETDPEKFRPLAIYLVEKIYPGCEISGLDLWTLESGILHPAHTDAQGADWVARIHVPIITNPHVVFTMEDGPHQMVVGKAYTINTLAPHAVCNGGMTPRVHFVFEVHVKKPVLPI